MGTPQHRSSRATQGRLATIDDPVCRALLELFALSGTAVQVWDATSECGIPVLLCEIRPRLYDPSALSRRSRGAGCHADRSVALSKALTEAAQVRLTHITGMRDDIFAAAYDDAWQQGPERLFSTPAARVPPRSFDMVPRSRRMYCGGRPVDAGSAECSGLPSVVVVDLTRPEFDIPVVRVIVPHLEGYSAHPGYRPGSRALRVEVTELWERSSSAVLASVDDRGSAEPRMAPALAPG